MKSIASSIAVTAGILMTANLAWLASAEVTENPYKVISARNGFDLKPPPPPPPTDFKPIEPPKSDLKFTGISKIGDVKRVQMASVDPKKPGQFTYYDIQEGASQDGIEVLDIDMNAASVKIRNGGIESVLTFEKKCDQPRKTGRAGHGSADAGQSWPSVPRRRSVQSRHRPGHRGSQNSDGASDLRDADPGREHRFDDGRIPGCRIDWLAVYSFAQHANGSL